jgi:hypothetical protein
MRVGEFTAKIIIGVIITVIDRVILTWAVASPRSDIWITLDWVAVERLPSMNPSHLQKLVDVAEIPANPEAKPIDYFYSLTLFELKLENTSRVTATNVEIHVNNAYFVLDIMNSTQLYRPSSDGLISMGPLRPGDNRTLYIVTEGFNYFNLSETIRVISDGIAVPVYVAKSFRTLFWTSYIVRNLNNSILAEMIAYLAICIGFFVVIFTPFVIYARYNQEFRIRHMNSNQRRTLLQDADFIRKHYKLDTLVYENETKPQSQPEKHLKP